jgi:uncharacterized protein (TIGR02246 family)
MKRLSLLMGVIYLAFNLPACAPAPEPEVDLRAEERALREVAQEVLVAYANRDSKAMVDMCDEPFLNLGTVFRGRERMQATFEAFFAGLGATQLNVIEEIGLEFITPEVAILITRFEFNNRPPDADGNPQPPEQYYDANVYVKKDGRWLRKAAFLRPITAALPIESITR